MEKKIKRDIQRAQQLDVQHLQTEIAKNVDKMLSAITTSLDTTMQTIATIDQGMNTRLDVMASQIDGLLEVTSAWFGEQAATVSAQATVSAGGSGESQDLPPGDTTTRPIQLAHSLPPIDPSLRDSVASMPISKKGDSMLTKS